MTPTPRRTGRPRRRRETRREPIEPLHPMLEPPDVDSFTEWDLGGPILAAIEAMGIQRPTPIQAMAIGPVLEGRDVIAKAETGTGKTLAFGAPMMARMDPARSSVLGLVLCPTRELCDQVHTVLAELGAVRGIKTAFIVGGEDMVPQVKALQGGAQVVVATPGRVLDLMNQGFLSFPWTEFVVLDEADKMLEIGFIDDVRAIVAACDENRQTMLFSATFPTSLLKLARESTRDPVEIATAKGIATVDTIAQYWLPVSEEGRDRTLADMIDGSGRDDVFLVFCARRTEVDRLLRRLERERFSVKALHGGYDQASRFRVMSAFREGDVKALVATDVASRGLDVLHVTHVVNYGVPRDALDYTHRIGRTGRAGRRGIAVTLVGPSNRRRWQALRRSAPYEITELASPGDLTRRADGSGRRRDAEGRRSGRGERQRGRARRDERGERRPTPAPRSEGAPTPEPTPTSNPASNPAQAGPNNSRPAAQEPATPFGTGVEGEPATRRRGRGRGRGRRSSPAPQSPAPQSSAPQSSEPQSSEPQSPGPPAPPRGSEGPPGFGQGL